MAEIELEVITIFFRNRLARTKSLPKPQFIFSHSAIGEIAWLTHDDHAGHWRAAICTVLVPFPLRHLAGEFGGQSKFLGFGLGFVNIFFLLGL